MKKDIRRAYPRADTRWAPPLKDDKHTVEQAMLVLLQDIRAVLYDTLDEVRETNRIVRLALGIDAKKEGE